MTTSPQVRSKAWDSYCTSQRNKRKVILWKSMREDVDDDIPKHLQTNVGAADSYCMWCEERLTADWGRRRTQLCRVASFKKSSRLESDLDSSLTCACQRCNSAKIQVIDTDAGVPLSGCPLRGDLQGNSIFFYSYSSLAEFYKYKNKQRRVSEC